MGFNDSKTILQKIHSWISPHLGEGMEVIDCWRSARSKVGNAALLKDEDGLEKAESLWRRAVDGCAYGDSLGNLHHPLP